MSRRLQMVALEKVDADDYHVRGEMAGEGFEELVRSVACDGILVPLLLESRGDRFMVLAGHRRLAAAVRVGCVEVPAYVADESDCLGWRASFAENMFRQDLSPIEEGAAIKDCLESGDFDVDGLAQAMGRSRDWVDGRLEILSWPEDLQLAVHIGWLPVGAARHLAQVSDAVYRGQLLEYAHTNGISVRTALAWRQAWEAGKGAAEAEGAEIPAAGGGIPAIEPQCPCMLCGEVRKMAELTYPPVCHGCGGLLVEMAAKLRGGGEGGPGN